MTTKVDKTQLHHHIVDEIRSLGDISMSLSNLIDSIHPQPTTEDSEKKVDPGYPSLREFLETAPSDLARRREHTLKQIAEVGELLYN